MPAILTGSPSRIDSLPSAADHPENLFTFLGGIYTLRVHESATRLCPQSLCPATRLPLIERLGGLLLDVRDAYLTRVLPDSVSGRAGIVDLESRVDYASTQTVLAFEALLDELGRHESDRTLYFAHLLLPHAPWKFVPSGSKYPFDGIDGIEGTDGTSLQSEWWGNEMWLVHQGYQRHLLQTGYVDRLLGRLLRQLDRTDLYDRSLLIVVADHGVSFKPRDARRIVTSSNLADIANVPMLVKYPGR